MRGFLERGWLLLAALDWAALGWLLLDSLRGVAAPDWAALWLRIALG